MTTRFRDAEKLAATVREELPSVAIVWLAAVRKEMEKLTKAALSGEVSDAEFRALVEATSQRLPELLEEMDHEALAALMEEGMGAAMANGIAHRTSDVERRTSKEGRAKLPWERDALLGVQKRRSNGQFGEGDGMVKPMRLDGSKWEGDAKSMHKRAEAAMNAMRGKKPFQHPESKVEMKVTSDGIRKSLHGMRAAEEFMVAASLDKVFLHASKTGQGTPDRQSRRGIKAFHRFETKVALGKQRLNVEIITKELEGNPIHHLKQIRIK